MANDLALPDAFTNPAFPGNQQALAALDPRWNVEKPTFGAGIRRGFAVVSIKGKVFRITHQGVQRPVLRPGTNEAAGSVDVILVDSTEGLSKVFYKDGYVEGNQEAPDCFSHDGVRPDRSVQTPQHSNCAACPNNAWGSKITEQGNKTKACADSKRIAITSAPHAGLAPDSDEALTAIANEFFGGTMLLRVPAASLADLAAYEAQMLQTRWPLNAIITRISFDINAAYPKLVFTPVRPLSQDEFAEVIALRDNVQTKDMLSGGAGDAAFRDEPAPHITPPVQQAPVQQAPVQQAPVQQEPDSPPEPAPAPRRTRRTAATAVAAPAPAQQAAPAPAPSAAESSLDDALSAILGD